MEACSCEQESTRTQLFHNLNSYAIELEREVRNLRLHIIKVLHTCTFNINTLINMKKTHDKNINSEIADCTYQ